MDLDHRNSVTPEDFQSIISISIDGFLLVSLEGNILETNDSYCQMIGYTRDELLSLQLPAIDAIDNRDDVAKRFKLIIQNGSLRFETKHRHKDGTIIDVEVSANYSSAHGGSIFSFVRDISNQKHHREIMAARLRLIEFSLTHSLNELLRQTLDEAETLTGSCIGFYHFKDPDSQMLTLQAWSTKTATMFCKAEGAGSHYPVSQAGVWVDCIRERRPVIHNDYASLPHKKGLPDGHAAVIRELVVPIFRNNKIVAIMGIGNKATDYTQQDVEIISILADLAWDVAERKRAEEALSTEKILLRSLIDAADDLIYFKDLNGTYLLCNKASEKFIGISESEQIGKSDFDLLDHKTAEVAVKQDKIVIEGGKSVRFEDVVSSAKSGTVVLDTLKTPIYGSNQQLIGLIGVSRDITERKQAEIALAYSERFLQTIIDTEPECIKLLDINCNLLMMNRAGLAMIEADSFEQVQGQCVCPLITDPYRDAFISLTKKVFQGISGNLEFETIGLKGRHVWLETHAVPFCDEHGKVSALLGMTRDISERKRSEAAVRAVEHRQAKMIENISDVIVIIDQNGINRYKSPNIEKWFGWKPEELVGANAFDNVHPDDLAAAQKFIGSLISESGATGTTECRYLCKDGSYKWIEITLVNLLDDPDIQGILGDYHDISERKQIEQVQSYLLQVSSLNTGEDFFESLASFLAKTLGMDYVCIDRLQGDFLSARTLAVYHDGRFEDNVEYTLKDTPCGDVVGKEVCVFPRGVCSLFPMDAALQDLQAESYVGTTLWSFDMKPIGLIAVIGRKALLNSNFAETVLKMVAIRAASELERRQAEEEKLIVQQQFQHAQKLESLGVLSGGIAHDFNNILAIIIGHCSLAKMSPDRASDHIPTIEKAADRAAGLCRQMLAYAGKGMFTMAQVNLASLVDEMVQMLKATTNQNVTIKHDLSPDVPAINGDASQLRQIVMNLIINASESIGDAQGVVQVTLIKTAILAGQSVMDHLGKAIPPGWYARLEVSDSGCGMDEETRRRIFEPFYTTKFTGRGLGMSAVLGIVAAHKGALQITSKPLEGSTFNIYLPIESAETLEDGSSIETASASWQGNGTILLVEDELQLQLVAKAMLENMGFSVIVAANGQEALDLYDKNSASISLVITDIGMPIMDGYALFQELKQLKRDLPIIISSGFGDSVVTTRIPIDEIAGLVSKPYRYDTLQDVVKSVVEGR